MRELERDSFSEPSASTRLAIVGRGRLGTALAAALREAGYHITGPLGRGASAAGVDAVLLCVPDKEIAGAARSITPGPLVGHCSGATGVAALAPHEAFSVHPLMTVTPNGARFAGAGATIAGSTPRALGLAAELAAALGMRAIEIDERDRPAYHAAASIASNFLVTLQASAELVAASAGVDRDRLVPLVRATVDNWATVGAERALTGPVARGDEATVAEQRAAIVERAPQLVPLFDAFVAATRALADRRPRMARPLQAAGTPPPSTGEGGMRTVRTVAELRAALTGPRRAGRVIGLVPTMGAFHDGHLSLMRRAREECDELVVSLFVNPTQFNEAADLATYPRDERRDAQLAAELGVDYLFAPPVDEIYPPGFATTVSVAGVTDTLEGVHRGGEHFDGVTTVVTKLFNAVSPDVAYFGQKDAQQAIAIKQLVRDLDMPVRIEVCPTVREPDGLAMSSRNASLSPADRARATSLHRALCAVQDAVSVGERKPEAATAKALAELSSAGVEPEYLELVSADTLTPVKRIDGAVLAVVAARLGATRLIDNEIINVLATAAAAGANWRP